MLKKFLIILSLIFITGCEEKNSSDIYLNKQIKNIELCEENYKKSLNKKNTNFQNIDLQAKLNDCYGFIITDLFNKYYPNKKTDLQTYFENFYMEKSELYRQLYNGDDCTQNCGTIIPLLVYIDMSVELKQLAIDIIHIIEVNN